MVTYEMIQDFFHNTLKHEYGLFIILILIGVLVVGVLIAQDLPIKNLIKSAIISNIKALKDSEKTPSAEVIFDRVIESLVTRLEDPKTELSDSLKKVTIWALKRKSYRKYITRYIANMWKRYSGENLK